jgi:hypothetical protein
MDQFFFLSENKSDIILIKSFNGKEANVNRAPDGSTYPSQMLVYSVFGKINYGGFKHNTYTWDWYCHLVCSLDWLY